MNENDYLISNNSSLLRDVMNDVILGIDSMAQIRAFGLKYLVENKERSSSRKATGGIIMWSRSIYFVKSPFDKLPNSENLYFFYS